MKYELVLETLDEYFNKYRSAETDWGRHKTKQDCHEFTRKVEGEFGEFYQLWVSRVIKLDLERNEKCLTEGEKNLYRELGMLD